jgi:NAD(P)-dependent dehydrogenase (short-subunit alcohol dehydrogenase family)
MSANATPSPQNRVWFVTGASRGFGAEIVKDALEQGDSVVATARNPQAVAQTIGNRQNLLAIKLDVRRDADAVAAVKQAIETFGRIDVLVNNAGHGLLGAVEEASDSEVANVFETNVFGLLRVTRAVLPHMRQRRSGHIVNMSSIGGLTAGPGWGIYAATKFAVEGLSEAMAQELAPLGIRVTIVEPGPFRTNFLGDSLATAAVTMQDYGPTAGRTRTWREENHGAQPGDPVRAAQAILQAVASDSPPLHLLLGSNAYDRAEAKLNSLQNEFQRWRELSLSTDYHE